MPASLFASLLPGAAPHPPCVCVSPPPQVYDPSLRVDAIGESAWHLRAEPVLEGEEGLDQPGALHVHCLQISREGSNVSVLAGRGGRGWLGAVCCWACVSPAAQGQWLLSACSACMLLDGPQGRRLGAAALPLRHATNTRAPAHLALAPLPQKAFAFADPFIMPIAEGETVGELKARVQQRLGLSGEEFDKWNTFSCA